MAHPFISLCGYAPVRHPFLIPCLLRPRGLPSVLVFTTIVWPVCARRSAVCGRVDVDLRYRRLLDCRGNCRSSFTLTASVGRAVHSAIRVERACGTDGTARGGGCLNVRSVHNYRGTRVSRVATRA